METRFGVRFVATLVACLTAGGCTYRTDYTVDSSGQELSGALPRTRVPLTPRVRTPLVPPRTRGENLLNQTACRTAVVLDERAKVLGVTWEQMGVSADHVAEYQSATAAIRLTHCSNFPGSVPTRDAELRLNNATHSFIQDIQEAQGISEMLAGVSLVETTALAVERLMELCGTELRDVGTYIESGGEVPGATCSGTVEDLANSISGSASTVRDAIACVSAAAADTYLESCESVVDPSDPVITEDQRNVIRRVAREMKEQVAALEAELEGASGDGADELRSRISDLKEQITVLESVASAPEVTRADVTMAVALTVVAAVGLVVAAVGLVAEGTLAAGVAAAGFVIAAAGMLTSIEALKDLSRRRERSGHGRAEQPGCGVMGFGFGAEALTMSDSLGNEMTIGDAFRQCLCDAMASSDTPVIGPAASCEEGPDADRRRCLLNPWGPDDGIRAECVLILEEDNELWSPSDGVEAICTVIDCPAGGDAVVSASGDSCLCEDPNRPATIEDGLADRCEAVLCPSGNRAVPAPDGGCKCQSGSSGFGGYDLGSGPGRLPGFGGSTPVPFPTPTPR